MNRRDFLKLVAAVIPATFLDKPLDEMFMHGGAVMYWSNVLDELTQRHSVSGWHHYAVVLDGDGVTHDNLLQVTR